LTGKDIGAGSGAVQSLHKQIRRAEERLAEGFYISRWYWDIESGGAGPTADMSRTRAPGFGPLVASRPAS
jgi:hypothetical protein